MPISLIVDGGVPVTTTITTTPPGLSIIADQIPCTSPCRFTWPAGEIHSVTANQTILGATGTQYVFTGWSDGGAASHQISAGSTYTASFTTQYLLTTSANPLNGGTVTPGNWCYSGAQVQIAAAANPGYQFSGFSGSLAGMSPQSLTMSGPMTVTANFASAGSFNLTDMAVSALFVDRHQWMVAAGGSSTADEALNSILPQADAAVVNSITASIKLQLDQLQSQSHSGAEYLALRNGILQNLQSQFQSQLSASSSGAINTYMQSVLRPQMSAVDPATAAPCVPTTSWSCMYLYSEINFYRGAGNARGLGGYVKSWVEGGDAANYCSSVKDFTGTFSPAVGDKTLYTLRETIPSATAAQHSSVSLSLIRAKGTYKVEAHHAFTHTYKNAAGGTVVEVFHAIHATLAKRRHLLHLPLAPCNLGMATINMRRQLTSAFRYRQLRNSISRDIHW